MELNVAFMGQPATMDAHKAYTNFDAQYLDPCTGQLFRLHPYKLFPCTLILVALMLACNLVADGLKDAFDYGAGRT